MSNDADLFPAPDEAFDIQRRGYSCQQVDQFVAAARSSLHEFAERLSEAVTENERLRAELAAARQDTRSKPAHEEVSERVGQILKLAEEEAKANRSRTQQEVTKVREEVRREADRLRTDARQQSERMLAAAREQAEQAIATARGEADKLRRGARADSERTASEAAQQAETAVSAAKAQAKHLLDEATMRATAIHDGAERRLNLLAARHTETMRRLTEIRDVVTNLVASESARGTLEEEVSKSVATSLAATGSAPARPAGMDGRRPPPQAPAPAAAGAGHVPQHAGGQGEE